MEKERRGQELEEEGQDQHPEEEEVVEEEHAEEHQEEEGKKENLPVQDQKEEEDQDQKEEEEQEHQEEEESEQHLPWGELTSPRRPGEVSFSSRAEEDGEEGEEEGKDSEGLEQEEDGQNKSPRSQKKTPIAAAKTEKRGAEKGGEKREERRREGGDGGQNAWSAASKGRSSTDVKRQTSGGAEVGSSQRDGRRRHRSSEEEVLGKGERKEGHGKVLQMIDDLIRKERERRERGYHSSAESSERGGSRRVSASEDVEGEQELGMGSEMESEVREAVSVAAKDSNNVNQSSLEVTGKPESADRRAENKQQEQAVSEPTGGDILALRERGDAGRQTGGSPTDALQELLSAFSSRLSELNLQDLDAVSSEVQNRLSDAVPHIQTLLSSIAQHRNRLGDASQPEPEPQYQQPDLGDTSQPEPEPRYQQPDQKSAPGQQSKPEERHEIEPAFKKFELGLEADASGPDTSVTEEWRAHEVSDGLKGAKESVSLASQCLTEAATHLAQSGLGSKSQSPATELSTAADMEGLKLCHAASPPSLPYDTSSGTSSASCDTPPLPALSGSDKHHVSETASNGD
eukprot:2046452-Rhodomonas_salina.1